MSNPFLPKWEYVPDGEPRVFGDRVYIYGSHDTAGSTDFCDYKLKVWSASIHDLENWTCHGVSFRTRADENGPADTDWTNNKLFAPDVVEKDGKYYLFAYIIGAKGCVAVSDKPEGPFELIGPYEYTISDEVCCNGWFIDPGVLVDTDGKVYIYCGFERSFMAQINPDKMNEVLDGTLIEHIIPVEEPYSFFEACSPRKIGDTYYMIYSPKKGNRLDYLTSKSPTGPFEYRGTIVDNGVDYPAGNNHGSICKIGDQWYVFYHRMTNSTLMSRRACVEKIEILEDGTIPQVEMTSLGFRDSLNPYEITPAEIACVLTGGCYVSEKNTFKRVIRSITFNNVIGYKYFDFGEDYASKYMTFSANVIGKGYYTSFSIRVDSPDGEEIGVCKVGLDDGVYSCKVKSLTGRHAIYFVVEEQGDDWARGSLAGRELFELSEFVFMK